MIPLTVKKNTRLRRRFAALLALVLLWGMLPVRAADPGETNYIVKLRDSETDRTDGGVPFQVVSREEMERLRDEDLLEWYEPDGEAVLIDGAGWDEAQLAGTLSPYYDDVQWNLDMIGTETAFSQNYLGQGVRVGVVDSGVTAHPDFGGRLLAGHNYIANAWNPDDTADSYGHGTQVAGLIAASGPSGYIGAAPGAEIVPLKCTDGKSIRISDICQAIYGGIDDYHCQVLNLSLGTTEDYQALREAVAYAAEKQVVVGTAAGNETTTNVYYPAGYDTVIGVGAVDSTGTVYTRSAHNDSVLVTAPGVIVRSTYYRGSGYTSSCTGTSFSVPQVSGAAAVLLGIFPDFTPGQIMALLAQTASDRGAPGLDPYYGYGILNLGGCVTELTSRLADPCWFLPEIGPARAVRNNTDQPLEALYLRAEYGMDGACRSVQSDVLTLQPGEPVEVEPPDGEGILGQFLCQPDTLAPLTAGKKIVLQTGE